MKVTSIQVFPQMIRSGEVERFSANIAIDGSWMIQLGTDGEFSIPRSTTACWSRDEDQDAAAELYDAAIVARELCIPTDYDALLDLGAEVF